MTFLLRLGLPFVLASAACGPSGAPDAGPEPDAGVPDAGAPAEDAGALDAGAPDAGPIDLDAPLGGDRPASVIRPSDYDPGQAYPLVIILHGYMHFGDGVASYFGFPSYVDARDFLLVVPDGTVDQDGARFWNATQACCDFYGSGVDDVGYLTGLITEAKARFNVDPERVIVVGHSNGGFMAYRMACEASEHVTGVVSVAGAMPTEAEGCDPAVPAVNVLQVHGTADDTIFFDGDVGYPGAEASLERWRTFAGCGETPMEGTPLNLDAQAPGAETTVTMWSGCSGGVAAELWTMDGVGHIPAFTTVFPTTLFDRVMAWGRALP